MLAVVWMRTTLRRRYLASDNPYGPDRLRYAIAGFDPGLSDPLAQIHVVLPLTDDAGDSLVAPITVELEGVPPGHGNSRPTTEKRQLICNRVRRHLLGFLLAQQVRAEAIQVIYRHGTPNMDGYRYSLLATFFEIIGDRSYHRPNEPEAPDDLLGDRKRLS